MKKCLDGVDVVNLKLGYPLVKLEDRSALGYNKTSWELQQRRAWWVEGSDDAHICFIFLFQIIIFVDVFIFKFLAHSFKALSSITWNFL